MPPSAAKGGSTDLAEKFIEQSISVEKTKIFSNFRHVQFGAIGPQQGSDVFQILRTSRIVHESLQLESDETLGTDHAQIT